MDEKWARRISELTRENAAIRREWTTSAGDPGPRTPAKAQASDELLDRFNANARWLELALRQAPPADLRQPNTIAVNENRIGPTGEPELSNSAPPNPDRPPGPGKHRGPDLDSS